MGGFSLTPSMRDFDSFIRECELLDPPLRNASFTWSNMQESPVCKRLDRFLYSNEWGLLFPQGLQEVLIRRTSDHWPIVLDTNPFMWGPTPFRFENMWLNHTKFKENFRDWWSGFQGNGWEGRGLNPDLLSQRASRKGELEELILREEIHWRQKAKVKWVKEGDCNSKFYHKVANGRRNRKYIKELENERGLVLKNAESITEDILHYFEKFYSNPTGESWGVEGLDWSPISEESALRLDSPFTEEEISKVIFSWIGQGSGARWLYYCRIQECWDVIKEDLVRVFAEFHRSGIINQSTNASFIVLIPKKSLPKRISDFRPISLITSLYKIIAKVLSGRLRGVLHETIHYTQALLFKGDKYWMRVFASVWAHFWAQGHLNKSSIYGINLDQALLSRLAEMLDCKASGWPILYLGLPLGGNPKACGFWDPVVERISSRLDGWQKAYLSFGGG
ncbi:Transposon TX1 uncharacterized 149 kDa protein [Vitis vinifera]|uniref:Transposon TX1 uncharacterized 149 kDa protein n=1 Tax=Vitis vinifera TaxID=29760 RepID=A0A438DK54_VITVI|nr:Transposon TX1 uncharacterized 149 kDa protein [Vitis vinifera]